MTNQLTNIDLTQLTLDIKLWGRELGFQQIGIADVNLGEHEQHLVRWLDNQYHGEMDYMERHGTKRSRPDELEPGTLRVITARMDYLPEDPHSVSILKQKDKAYISRYALGRDYHKLIRKRLTKLAKKIETVIGPFGHRAFVDSAPVLEKALAEKSGLGWIGKNSLLLNRKAGSWYFLGELFIDLPLPVDEPVSNHCGSCQSCIDKCPTNAIVAPFQVDSRKCISYLTIELKGPIPETLRSPMGNRVFGCDDCQLVCPWNRFAKATNENDFHPRHQLDNQDLLALFLWDETTFLSNTEGSAIRRIGYERWLRNLAVGLGNAPYSTEIVKALTERLNQHSELVDEHVQWAITQQEHRKPDQLTKK
ncbi:tRNA epoxyqueuosine(34) reductase QueG [Gammaproteobacteria bacterium 42_54_T18]|nr:tRNA epoxyqueuosine(34) reductase QueG [Gammaproteobacteria bacterium 42_54_T18]